jgi:hypothetical protein
MSDPTVFRTTSRAVLDAWEAGQKALNEWRGRFNDGCAALGIDPDQVIANTWTGRIKGVRDYSNTAPAEGWRHDQRAGLRMPALKTPAGRQIAAALDELRRPQPADGLPGLPLTILNNRGLYLVHVQQFDNSSLYARWESEVGDRDGVDLHIWERVKLSDYYLVVEAHENTSAGAPDA